MLEKKVLGVYDATWIYFLDKTIIHRRYIYDKGIVSDHDSFMTNVREGIRGLGLCVEL